jgi:hypothetical protein
MMRMSGYELTDFLTHYFEVCVPVKTEEAPIDIDIAEIERQLDNLATSKEYEKLVLLK